MKMIVIPVYGSYWFVERLLKSIERHGDNGYRICLVNTHTQDIMTIKYLEVVKDKFNLDIVVETADEGFGYEAGAAITAIKRYPEVDRFFMIHDSVEATSEHWITQFEEKMHNGVVTWVAFQPCLFAMCQAHIDYIHQIVSTADVPNSGFFGGMFMAEGKILREMEAKGYFNVPAKLKIHSEAWERIWSILFHVEGHAFEHIHWGFNPSFMAGYPHMIKTFGGRNGIVS